MTRLHFQPIEGKMVEIIEAILQTKEVAGIDGASDMLRLVVEELVVNVVDYAYPDGNGYLDVEVMSDDERITLRFRDGGVPFNPLEKELPDTSLPMEERRIGGLGILLVIKKADFVDYEYTNGENVLTVIKKIKE